MIAVAVRHTHGIALGVLLLGFLVFVMLEAMG